MELLAAVLILIGLPILVLIIVMRSAHRAPPATNTPAPDRLIQPLISAGAADVVPVVERLLAESQHLLRAGRPSGPLALYARGSDRRAHRLMRRRGLTDVRVDPERRSQGVLASMQGAGTASAP